MRRPPIDERLAAIPLFAGLDARQLTCVASLATPIDVGVPKFVEWFKGYEGA